MTRRINAKFLVSKVLVNCSLFVEIIYIFACFSLHICVHLYCLCHLWHNSPYQLQTKSGENHGHQNTGASGEECHQAYSGDAKANRKSHIPTGGQENPHFKLTRLWRGWRDSNPRKPLCRRVAWPLGYTPNHNLLWGGATRECRYTPINYLRVAPPLILPSLARRVRL